MDVRVLQMCTSGGIEKPGEGLSAILQEVCFEEGGTVEWPSWLPSIQEQEEGAGEMHSDRVNQSLGGCNSAAQAGASAPSHSKPAFQHVASIDINTGENQVSGGDRSPQCGRSVEEPRSGQEYLICG